MLLVCRIKLGRVLLVCCVNHGMPRVTSKLWYALFEHADPLQASFSCCDMRGITLGPGTAIGVGICIVIATGNSATIVQWLQSLSGNPPDAARLDFDASKPDISSTQLLQSVNKQLDNSMTQIKVCCLSWSAAANAVLRSHLALSSCLDFD